VVIDEEKITVVPGWVALGLASRLEWSVWLFMLGRKRPPLNVSRLYILYTFISGTIK
jgi:hypothetical protein